MSDANPSLTAKWPDGRPVEPGDDALRFLFEEALRLGENPAHLKRVLFKDDTAGRTILKLLGLTREALRRPPHRPTNPNRQALILRVVEQVAREHDLRGDELYAETARLLADPARRLRKGFNGHNELVVKGNGSPGPMTVGATRNAHRAAREALMKRLFEPIEGEVDTSAFDALAQASSTAR